MSFKDKSLQVPDSDQPDAVQFEAVRIVSMQYCQLYYAEGVQDEIIDEIQALIAKHKLPLTLKTVRVEGKINQKLKQQLSSQSANAALILENKDKLSLLSDGLCVAPEWDKLQQRVVSAGRKSELLLQAAKITADSYVIDATAGFGHDSLILASTGAQVSMLEQQPVIALLLLVEQQRMSSKPNWQNLMSRLQIINTDAYTFFEDFSKEGLLAGSVKNLKTVDVIYLDPMFPEDSYQDKKSGKGAKVGKHMQALHHVARPPTLLEEQQLLKSAQRLVAQHLPHSGRVIVKRPQQAPFLAKQTPDESWHNAAVRFDGYFF